MGWKNDSLVGEVALTPRSVATGVCLLLEERPSQRHASIIEMQLDAPRSVATGVARTETASSFVL